MGPLAAVVLAGLIFGVGIWLRRRRGQSSDHVFALKLAGIAVGAGTVTVGALYPFAYVVISRAVYGGPIASNMPPGVSEDALFGMATLGAATFLLISA